MTTMNRHIVEIGSRRFRVGVGPEGAAEINDSPVGLTYDWIDPMRGQLLLIIKGRSFDLRIEPENESLVITYAGIRYRCVLIDERIANPQSTAAPERRHTRASVRAPMPGMIVKVLVQEGAEVSRGDRLIVLEAMKMENDVKAPRSGRIAALNVVPRQTVEAGRELLVIE